MEDNSKSNVLTQEEGVFTLKEYLTQCVVKWKWFLLSVFLFCTAGIFYILSQQPEYSRSMSVLIKNQDSGSSITDISSAFSTLGFGGQSTNVNNELISLTSPAVMAEVIERLGLCYNYEKQGTFHGTTLYGSTAPFSALFNDIDSQDGGGFELDWNDNGQVTLRNFYKIEDRKRIGFSDYEVKGKVDGSAIRTPIGRVVLTPNPGYVPTKKIPMDGATIIVTKDGLQSAIEYYTAKMKGDFADKDADVIDLSIKDESIQRAVDLLNTVVEVYNETWVQDKNKVAVATSSFIDDRLKIIEKELGVVDNEIARYKSAERIPDLKEAAKQSMIQSADLTTKMLEITNQLSMAGYVKDYISNPANINNVIPVNTGMGSMELESQISTYNTMLLNRNNLAANSSDQNPLVLDYDAQLRGLREAISRAVTTQVSTLQKTLANMQGAKGAINNQLSEGPTQAKFLLSVERQQKVKESLYLYLLQKREENEVSQTFTAYNTRIITPPMGSMKPVTPKKMMILGMMFLFGLIIPGIAVYVNVSTDNKVRGRRDLDRLRAPFAGEIPFVSARKRRGLRKGKTGKVMRGGKELENVVVAVRDGSRDEVSEAFRIVRGSLEFMMKSDDGNIVMITSFNPGSGKSFVAFNLAASFALKGKKVLVIDGDLRHGSSSQFVGMPSKGLSNYLTGSTPDWQNLVVAVPEHDGVYVLPIGHRPPNPSELLDNGKIKDLIEEASKDYDYVFIDCPPVDIVVDTQILEKYVDRTLFVVRAGLFEKKSVVEVNALYETKRFKNMSIILNATDSQHSRTRSYGSYGYYGN